MRGSLLAVMLGFALLVKTAWFKLCLLASGIGLGSVYNHEGCFDHSAIADILQSCGLLPLVYTGSADVLLYPGLAIINSSGVDAMTLATPVAGAQAAGGDDGKTLTVIDAGGHAHTITTATNKIVPSHHVLTFNGTAGSSVVLIAWNGLWYVEGTPSGVTAS
jgi:hypothetical protein